MNLDENQLDLGTRTQYQSNITGWQQGGPSNIFSRMGSAFGSVFGSGQRQARDFRTQIKQNIITGAVGQAISDNAFASHLENATSLGFDPKNVNNKAISFNKYGPSIEYQALGNKELAEGWKKKHDELQAKYDELLNKNKGRGGDK
jgi:topoisomerase IA-like protein